MSKFLWAPQFVHGRLALLLLFYRDILYDVYTRRGFGESLQIFYCGHVFYRNSEQITAKCLGGSQLKNEQRNFFSRGFALGSANRSLVGLFLTLD
jgi:hypothetical protein